MTTTCFICGLKISDAEGHMLSILNIGNYEKNQASYICKRYHKKKKEKQIRKYVKESDLELRVKILENKVEYLDRNYWYNKIEKKQNE
jgi:hypothetical protein